MEEQKLPETSAPVDVPVAKPTEIKTKFPVMNLVLGLVILILVGTSGFLAYQNMKLQKQISGMKIASPTSIVADPTANWKTYSNSQFGFSFKYPTEGFNIREGISPDKFVYVESTQGIQPNQQIPYYFYAGRFNNPQGLTVDQVMGNSVANIPGGFQFVQSTMGQYKIYTTDKMPSQSGQLCRLFTTDGSKYGLLCLAPYNVNLLTGNQGSQGEQDALRNQLKTFDQILSTFQFTTPTSQNDTSSWQTVRNDLSTYTFKVPKDWKVIEHSSNFQYNAVVQSSDGLMTVSGNAEDNINKSTGKPYNTLDEFIGFPYTIKTLTVAGQDARQPLPRAGSENIDKAYFFSTDSKLIYSVDLQVGDNSVNDPRVTDTAIKAGQQLFDQILSTFKFTQ